MPDIVFQPELHSEPLDIDVILSYSFIELAKENGNEPPRISLKKGLNRAIDPVLWEAACGYDQTKSLLKTGALRVHTSVPEDEQRVPSLPDKPANLKNLSLESALELIELTHDTEELDKWHTVEDRVKVRNSIARRRYKLERGQAD
jgi:hypothetical protein